MSGLVRGNHYSTYPDEVRQLVTNGKIDQAEQLLLALISATEEESQAEGLGVAPWYYEELAKLYRRSKQPGLEIDVLRRFSRQRHAPGVKPAKLLKRLVDAEASANRGLDDQNG